MRIIANFQEIFLKGYFPPKFIDKLLEIHLTGYFPLRGKGVSYIEN
jgi:hypothetical protein